MRGQICAGADRVEKVREARLLVAALSSLLADAEPPTRAVRIFPVRVPASFPSQALHILLYDQTHGGSLLKFAGLSLSSRLFKDG